MKTTESTKTTEKNTPANETKVNAETKDKDTSVKISVKNLKKTFGKLQVLKDINIDIHEGEVVVVIGPSGSGKSTFLRCLNKLEQSNGGSIIVNGEDINDKKIYSGWTLNRMKEAAQDLRKRKENKRGESGRSQGDSGRNDERQNA